MQNTYESLVGFLAQQVRGDYPKQVLDPSRTDLGAYISPGYGIACADHTSGGASLVRGCYAYLLEASTLRGDEELFSRIMLAADFICRWQRPTGLIDLPHVDFDSPPDTAFMVQLVCPVLKLANRRADEGDETARRLAQQLSRFVERAARGIVGRGFRTPNHRWVVCSALAQAMELFPDLDALDYVNSILAETIDINADGEYSERSTGIYSAVCNRSLRFVADCLKRPEFLEPVRANLDFMASIMEDDGNVATSISRRQDNGAKQVPYGMADSFLDMAMREDNGTWGLAARRLLAHGDRQARAGLLPWALEPLASHDAYCRRTLPAENHRRSSTRFFPASGLWRVRQGDTSALAAAHTAHLFSVCHHGLALRSLQVHGAYFHCSHFEADKIEGSEDRVLLRHQASKFGNWGWDLPLNRPLRFDNPHVGYYPLADSGGREKWLLPKQDLSLEIRRVADGFDLHLRSEGGYDRVPFVVQMDISGGTMLETSELSQRPGDRQTVLLRSGEAIIHDESHALSISPGGDAHRLLSLSHGEVPSGCVRILIALVTPLDHRMHIGVGQWSEATRTVLRHEESRSGAEFSRPGIGVPRPCVVRPSVLNSDSSLR